MTTQLGDAKHLAQMSNWIRKRRQETAAYIRSLKNVPCADCGVKYPHYVMDFDHRPGVEKSFTLAQAVNKHISLKRIDAEAAKCDIVCANCHRERTWGPGRERPWEKHAIMKE